ncbi:MAG: DNRLRE domain-containing protein, partial [Acidobacteria bacterium]|nr:DNRLRE domain-containing protein [Acidobacteriota bacterium]
MLCTSLLAGAGSRLARAEFALLAPEKDSTLIESSSGSFGNGSGPAIFAGRNSSTANSIRRALVEFDLSSLPPGSIVTKAVLSLNLSSTNAGPVPIRLHRVLAEWGEGASSSSGGGGAPSTPGDSTWIHRFYPDAFWNQAGGDFDPTPSGVALVDQLGFYSWGSTAEMVSDTQEWLDHPEAAHGWILLGDESLPTTVKRFDSRESPDQASWPLLYVEYTPPCAPDPKGPGYWDH